MSARRAAALRRLAVAALAALAAGAAAAPARAGEIALSFHDAPGDTTSGFRIERRAAGAKKFEPIALVGPGTVEFVDRSAPEGRLLCYRVRALAGNGSAEWSSEVCARAQEEGAAPSPPAGETAASGAAPAASDARDRRVRAGGGWLQVLE